jgi:hypothetical protein
MKPFHGRFLNAGNTLRVITLLHFHKASADFTLFPYSSRDGSPGNPIDAATGFGNTSAISSSCANALNTTIACDSRIQFLASSNYYGSMNSTGIGSLCTLTCAQSLASYHASVAASCDGTAVYAGMPNTWRSDILWNFYNLTCATDPTTGQYCPGK